MSQIEMPGIEKDSELEDLLNQYINTRNAMEQLKKKNQATGNLIFEKMEKMNKRNLKFGGFNFQMFTRRSGVRSRIEKV